MAKKEPVDQAAGAKEVVFLYAGGADHVVGAAIGSSSFAIEDSRSLWDQIWNNREVITEIGHSHPRGPGHLSGTDRETAQGICAALGKSLYFSVAHPGGFLRRQFHPDGTCGPEERMSTDDEPWWAALLWRMSYAFEPRNAENAENEDAPAGAHGGDHHECNADGDHDHDPDGQPHA